MSKHIGTVYSLERNEKSPQASVDASRAGGELAAFDPSDARADRYVKVVTFQPADARTIGALMQRGAEEVEIMRGEKATHLGSAAGFAIFVQSTGVRIEPEGPREKYDPDTARELSLLLAKASNEVERMRREAGTP